MGQATYNMLHTASFLLLARMLLGKVCKVINNAWLSQMTLSIVDWQWFGSLSLLLLPHHRHPSFLAAFHILELLLFIAHWGRFPLCDASNHLSLIWNSQQSCWAYTWAGNESIDWQNLAWHAFKISTLWEPTPYYILVCTPEIMGSAAARLNGSSSNSIDDKTSTLFSLL